MKAKPYIELILAVVFSILTLVTIIWPMWIEILTAMEPDQGTGQLERIIVAIFAALAVLTIGLSRKDLARLKTPAVS